MLNRPRAGGAGRATPDGRVPTPGGSNRIQIRLDDLPAKAARMRDAGCRFPSEIVVGNGGKQILVDDPPGKPIELFEPA